MVELAPGCRWRCSSRAGEGCGLRLQCVRGKGELYWAKWVSVVTAVGTCWHQRHPRQLAVSALAIVAIATGGAIELEKGGRCFKMKGETTLF